jgi:hypothetical protein
VGRYGSLLDFRLPVWRTAEAVLHSARFANAVGEQDAPIAFEMRWDGLQGRTLSSVFDPSRDIAQRRPAAVPEVRSLVRYRASSVMDDLVGLVIDLTRPLYEVFDFFAIPEDVVRTEVAKLRSGI